MALSAIIGVRPLMSGRLLMEIAARDASLANWDVVRVCAPNRAYGLGQDERQLLGQDHCSTLALLVSVFRSCHDPGRAKEDFHIEPERPLANVFVVAFDAALHLLQRVGFAAPAADLSQPRDAGFYLVAEHVALNHFAILLVVRRGVWTR